MTHNEPRADRRSEPRTARRAAVALAAAAGLALVGCGRSSPTGRAVGEMSVKLASLSPSGNPAPAQVRVSTYNAVIAGLQPVAGRGTPAENAAAALLIAQAQTGLAEVPAAEAARLHREILHAVTRVHASAGQWVERNAAAEAALLFDPAPELAELDEQSGRRDTEIAERRRQRAEIDAQVADLRARSKGKADEAAALREREGALLARLADVSAVEGESIQKEARTIRRQADALEAEAAGLEAQAEKSAPQANLIQLDIEKLESQKRLLGEAKQEVARRGASAKARAESAREAARQAATEVQTALGELAALRVGPRASDGGEGGRSFLEAMQDAIDTFSKAASSARSAQADAGSRMAAKLAEGTAQQALGDMHSMRAQELEAHTELMSHLAGLTPPLPDADAHRQAAEEAKAQASEASSAACDAYEAAAGAYRGAGARGEAGDRLNQVNARLASRVNRMSNGQRTIEGAEEIAPSEPGAPEPGPGATAAADPSTPLGTLRLLKSLAEQDDTAGMLELTHAEGDSARAMLDLARAITAPVQHLDAACRERFGQTFTEAAQQLGAGAPGMGAPTGGVPGFSSTTLRDVDVDALSVEQTDDRATVALPGSDAPLALRLVDGRWLVDLDAAVAELPPEAAAMSAMVGTMGAAMGEAFEALATEVEAGQYQSIQEVIAALGQKLMQAMRPPGGGGG